MDGAADAGTDQPKKDESKPAPNAQEPDKPFGNDQIAPRGRGSIEPAAPRPVRRPQGCPDGQGARDATGKTKEQLEQFARSFEKQKVAPGREAKDVEVKVGEQPAAKPGSNLPTVTSTKTSTDKIRSRGNIPQDAARGNNEGNRSQPPAELRDRVNGYNSRLGRIQMGSGRAAAAKPASK